MTDTATVETLTARQRAVLAFIRTSIADHGYPPSMREIGAAVGLSSNSSVAHQLRALERKGFLRRNPTCPRTITISDTAQEACSAVDSARPLDLIDLIGKAWDDGNGTGLDGWTGPGRGAGEVDDEAVYRRDRCIRTLLEEVAHV